MSLTIRLSLPDGWKHYPAAVEKGLQTGLSKATIYVTNQAIDRAPRKTGTLKRSIHMQVSAIGSFTGKIIQDTKVAKYGPFVEYGTGVHGPKGSPIAPKTAKFLQWKSGGKWVRKKSVQGMAARPYMRPALQESVGKIESIINEQIKIALQEVKGNGG